MERDIFKNISPWDHRYSLKEEDFQALTSYYSEEARVLYQAQVELALVEELHAWGYCPERVVWELKKAVQSLQVEDVYREEEKTRHNMRALVNVLVREMSLEARPFVHLTATSMDIMDTADALRYRQAQENLITPVLKAVLEKLIELSLQEKDTLQAGRTHGQHAVPITFGFVLAGYVQRLGRALENLQERAGDLRGKLAGAVGAYNAASFLLEDPVLFEARVLERLGLQAAPVSTQIVPPEYLLDYMHSLVAALGILADFADDMRHLQRTEIGEVGEYFSAGQVGSSTMPHKKNPINYENIKSIWKTAVPRINTCYMDQLSEHQRDLTNSASSRFYVDIPVALYLCSCRLKHVLERFFIDRQSMLDNMKKSGDLIMAEPLYIFLAVRGYPQAHEAVRKLAMEAREKKQSLFQTFQEKEELKPYLEEMTEQQKSILGNVGKYTGRAGEKTEEICRYWLAKLRAGEI